MITFFLLHTCLSSFISAHVEALFMVIVLRPWKKLDMTDWDWKVGNSIYLNWRQEWLAALISDQSWKNSSETVGQGWFDLDQWPALEPPIGHENWVRDNTLDQVQVSAVMSWVSANMKTISMAFHSWPISHEYSLLTLGSISLILCPKIFIRSMPLNLDFRKL
jgi:hypothetical protein